MFWSFLSLHSSCVMCCYVFSRSIRYPWQTMVAGSWRLDGALRLGPRSATVDYKFSSRLQCSVGTSHVSIKFCYVYQVLSRFPRAKIGWRVVFEPICAHAIKKRSPHFTLDGMKRDSRGSQEHSVNIALRIQKLELFKKKSGNHKKVHHTKYIKNIKNLPSSWV